MSHAEAAEARSQSFWMLISAGIFAYFGFATAWPQLTTTNPPETIAMVVLLKWTIRVSACAFAGAWLLSLLGTMLGPILYAAAGLVGAVIFVIVAIWEWTNPQGYYSGVPAILLLIFAVWNGVASIGGLVSAFRRAPAAEAP
ncbi:MAG: hypothetical protein ACYTGP_03090 [Planctomycetota bacterium]|jgi:hypothetical protein